MYNLYVYGAYEFVKLEILGFCEKVEEDGEGGLMESEVFKINAGLLTPPLSLSRLPWGYFLFVF